MKDKIVDGVCTDSIVFKTAAKFGIPETIIERAKSFSSHVATPVYDSHMTSSSSNDIDHLSNENEVGDQFNQAMTIVKDVSGQSVAHIKPKWSPPAFLEGNSVVYVMHVGNGFYVGETNSFELRVR